MTERTFSHSAPLSNRDFDFFYDGLERNELLIQRCLDCGNLRSPPGPGCPRCGSIAWDTVAAKGTGTLFSFTVHRHPPLPGFAMPHPVGIVDLAEGVRMVGALDPLGPEEIAIGMPLQLEFVRRGAVASYRFRKALAIGGTNS